MLISAEHGICSAKSQILADSFCLNIVEYEYFPANKCEMPTINTIVGILIFISRENFFAQLS